MNTNMNDCDWFRCCKCPGRMRARRPAKRPQQRLQRRRQRRPPRPVWNHSTCPCRQATKLCAAIIHRPTCRPRRPPPAPPINPTNTVYMHIKQSPLNSWSQQEWAASSAQSRACPYGGHCPISSFHYGAEQCLNGFNLNCWEMGWSRRLDVSYGSYWP